ISPIFSEIIFHAFFDPVPLISLPCVFRGRPIFPLPGSSTNYFAAWVTTIIWNVCAYAACFIHRHQAVIPPGSLAKISIRSRRVFLAILFAFSLACGPIITARIKHMK
ncbi:hypothetical protein PRIPAC_95284, partial [Pristionchus pacificus]|uniref:Uncharacterized protein n=1 Tax=Pristionchus pacificus TaxID=54126 RepID=A0A2A6D2B0_PRIPA